MKLLVFSRREAENKGIVERNCPVTHLWISICGKGDTKPQPVVLPNCKGVLSLCFDDITKQLGDYFLMTEQDADKILDFVLDTKVELICVHCEAGISRSAAVASALDLLFNQRDDIATDPHFFPNIHVKSLLLQKIRERSSLAEKS
jgi:predicted protein tyrosine phosphatase